MKRLPAYAKKLITQRREGLHPWLVSVAVGRWRDAEVLRGVPGVARIGWSDVASLDEADWWPVLGLDVLLSVFVLEDRDAVTLAALGSLCERLPPATLWLSDARGGAVPVSMERGADGRWEFAWEWENPFPLNARFRAVVERARWMALYRGDGVFERPEFSQEMRDAAWVALRESAAREPLGHAAG